MRLNTGSRLGPYEVTAPLGAGGMGEVYRARDTRLNREVAIKVLPAAVARDPERLARFEREAQLLASLNHPGIGAIYGLEESGDDKALVLEIVEGPTLADRMREGPMPLDEALPIARQIAEALEAAHEQGIVHRDLKPANIKLRPDGAVKVLDFGLAKALEPAATAAGDVSRSPTITMMATQAGIILGTAAYMAPEQAKGRGVDRRADIWAFGVVLGEMLTGRRLFPGETPSEVLAAVILKDPDLTDLPAATPGAVRHLLARCLDKDPKRRLRDIGEARLALDEPSGASMPGTRAAAAGAIDVARRAPARPRWLEWTAGVLALGLFASLTLPGILRSRVRRPVARYDALIAAGTSLSLASRPAVAISRDGATLAYAATAEGISRLYVRKRDQAEARPVTGTEGASNPVFSPDGRWVAFFADNQLKKASLDGQVVALAAVNDARGVAWVDDGHLVYSPEAIGPLYMLSSGGGAPRAVTTLDAEKEERSHRWPEALEGGRAVLFTVGTVSSPDNYDESTIDSVVLATGERRVVLEGASMVRYIPPGFLIFARAGSLYAVRFDAGKIAVTGSPVPVVQGVAGDTPTGASHFSCSDDGTLAYVAGSKQWGLRRLVWVDRSGRSRPIDLAPGNYNDVRISPDGERAAVAVGTSGSADVWIYDFGRKTFTRLTFNGTNGTPVWSRDGSSVLYASVDARGRKSSVLRVPADGSREAETLLTVPTRVYLGKVFPDGGTILIDYFHLAAAGKTDVMRIALKQGAEPVAIAATKFDEYAPMPSPDGRWIAYQSDDTGRDEVYVRGGSGTGGRWQISTEGGEEPGWSPDGRELYYRSESRFMAVPVGGGATFQAGVPRLMFDGVYRMRSDTGISYDVDPKGDRFLMIRPAEEGEATAGVRIALNWIEEVERLMAERR